MLGSHHSDDFHRLGRRNLVAWDSSPKVRCQSIPTTCAHSVLNSSSSTKRFIRIGDISKVIIVVVKHGHKKEKIRKALKALLNNIKTSEDKTERNLNEGKFVLKLSFKKEKTKVLSTNRIVSDREAHMRYMITQTWSPSILQI